MLPSALMSFMFMHKTDTWLGPWVHVRLPWSFLFMLYL